MKKLFLLLSLIFTLSLTSCLDNESGSVITNDAFIGFNKVNPVGDPANAKFKAASYKMALDFTKSTIELEINSAYEEDADAVVLNLGKLPFKMSSEGGYTVSVDQIKPKVNGQESGRYLITNFKGKIWVYYKNVGGKLEELKIYEFSYIINNVTEVVAYTHQPLFNCPETKVTDQGGKLPEFKTSLTQFQLTYNPTSANVRIINAKFAEGMPQMDMTLTEVPFVFTPNGLRIFAEKAVPSVNDTPFPQFTFQNFTMNVYGNGSEMTVRFTCPVKGSIYAVEAQGSVYPKKEEPKN